MAPARTALIIGGGIGGLSTAVALGRAGIDVQVFERRPELSEIGAGITLWSNASMVLAHLGLTEPMKEITSPIETMETRTMRGRNLQRIPLWKLKKKVRHESVGFHRKELLQLLASVISEDRIHLDAEFASLEREGDKVTATMVDGRTFTADFLVGADGIFSSVRRQLFPAQEVAYGGYVCWRGVTEFEAPEDWPPRASVRTMGRGMHFGIVELTKDRYFWYATRDEALDEPEHGGRKATLLRHFGNWHHPIPEIIEATSEGEMLRHGIYEMPPLKRWGTGRVTLLGDAAHPMKPSLGMGACQAIEDALILAHYIKSSDSVESDLRAYEEHRRRRAHKIVRSSHVLARTEQFKSPFMCTVRDLGTRLLPEFAALKISELSWRFEVPGGVRDG